MCPSFADKFTINSQCQTANWSLKGFAVLKVGWNSLNAKSMLWLNINSDSMKEKLKHSSSITSYTIANWRTQKVQTSESVMLSFLIKLSLFWTLINYGTIKVASIFLLSLLLKPLQLILETTYYFMVPYTVSCLGILLLQLLYCYYNYCYKSLVRCCILLQQFSPLDRHLNFFNKTWSHQGHGNSRCVSEV